ncbi:MAG: hypothetical protein INR68_18555 [Methylobacterium mesophilicum]|nr:hypothetical protein [Methylobacterium mesophilicum]
MIDLSQLTQNPAVQTAIEAQRAAEQMVIIDPTVAQGDPSAFVAIFTLYAFASAEGDCAVLRNILDRAGVSALVGRA